MRAFGTEQHSYPNKIIIVGGGTTGWMSAHLLHQAWPNNGPEICLIESIDVATVGVGEATVPTIHFFLKPLKLKNPSGCHIAMRHINVQLNSSTGMVKINLTAITLLSFHH